MTIRNCIMSMVLLLLCPVFAGCAGPALRNADLFKQAADAQVKLVEAQLKQEAERAKWAEVRMTALANACATDKNPRECLRDIAMFETMNTAMASMERVMTAEKSKSLLPPVPYERDNAAKFTDAMSVPGNLMGMGMGMYKDVELAKIGQENTYAQYDFLSSVTAQANQTAREVAASAQPSYNVSGVLVQGNQHNGHNVNGSQNALDGSTVDDADTAVDVRGNHNALGQSQVSDDDTQTTVDVTGALVNESTGAQIEQGAGDQRIASPGPIDDHSDPGDDCTESDCTTNPGGGAP